MNNYQYAGFWIRVLASFIDGFLVLFVVGSLLTMLYGSGYWTEEPDIRGFWDAVLNYVLPLVATVWFWTRFGATPGKMALKIKILDARTGGKLSVGKALLRYLGYIVSAIPFLLGYFWIGFDKKKQGFHDKIAGTVVVRVRSLEEVTFEQAA